MAIIETGIDETWGHSNIIVIGKLRPDQVIDIINGSFRKDPAENVIWDFTQANLSEFKLDNLQNIVDEVKVIPSVPGADARDAFVVQNEGQLSILKLFTALADTRLDNNSYRIFETREEALAWLYPRDGQDE